MSKEQIIEIVTDAYSARNEIKEYFEFFLNPDVEKLKAKYQSVIVKELNRQKWGTSKARTTILKKALKNFISYNPGPENVLKFMVYLLNMLGHSERYLNFPATLYKYVETLTHQIIKYGDDNRLTSEAMSALNAEANNYNLTTYFRQHVRRAVDNY